VVFRESPLQRVKPISIGQPLHSQNAGTLCLNGQHQAGLDRLAIDNHRASPTHTVFAADVGSCQAEILTQKVGQQAPCFDRGFADLAVDLYLDLNLVRPNHR
jgi:hypothetical protein